MRVSLTLSIRKQEKNFWKNGEGDTPEKLRKPDKHLLFRMEAKIGTIEIGKWADIIAVDGHPDEDRVYQPRGGGVRRGQIRSQDS